MTRLKEMEADLKQRLESFEQWMGRLEHSAGFSAADQGLCHILADMARDIRTARVLDKGDISLLAYLCCSAGGQSGQWGCGGAGGKGRCPLGDLAKPEVPRYKPHPVVAPFADYRPVTHAARPG